MARESGRLIVAYQPTPHGNLDREMLATFRQAGVPFLLGAGIAMRSLNTSHREPAIGVPALANSPST
jgi:hypothetical protein